MHLTPLHARGASQTQDAGAQAEHLALDAEPARKLRHAELSDAVRILLPTGGSPPVWMHKDPIDWGAEAQIFVGVQAGRPVILRRLNALGYHTPDGCRHTLSRHRHRRAVAAGRPGAQGVGPQAFDDTVSLVDIAHDVAVSRLVAQTRHQPFSALFTRRGDTGPISKVFELIVPRQGDLLEVMLNLEGQDASVRAAVAGVCIGSLAGDLATLSAQGVAHGDVREENVLLRVDPSEHGDLVVEMGDFGLARAPTRPGDIAAEDQAALARLIVVMLAPRERVALMGQDLATSATLGRLSATAPGWAALVGDLLAGEVARAPAVRARLAGLGLTGPDHVAVARRVLASTHAKADELRERLQFLAAHASGEVPAADAPIPSDPWATWPAELTAAADRRVALLAAAL